MKCVPLVLLHQTGPRYSAEELRFTIVASVFGILLALLWGCSDSAVPSSPAPPVARELRGTLVHPEPLTYTRVEVVTEGFGRIPDRREYAPFQASADIGTDGTFSFRLLPGDYDIIPGGQRVQIAEGRDPDPITLGYGRLAIDVELADHDSQAIYGRLHDSDGNSIATSSPARLENGTARLDFGIVRAGQHLLAIDTRLGIVLPSEIVDAQGAPASVEVFPLGDDVYRATIPSAPSTIRVRLDHPPTIRGHHVIRLALVTESGLVAYEHQVSLKLGSTSDEFEFPLLGSHDIRFRLNQGEIESWMGGYRSQESSPLIHIDPGSSHDIRFEYSTFLVELDLEGSPPPVDLELYDSSGDAVALHRDPGELFSNLLPGTYYLKILGNSFYGIVSQWYDQAPSRESARAIQIGEGTNSLVIESLHPGAVIELRVRDDFEFEDVFFILMGPGNESVRRLKEVTVIPHVAPGEYQIQFHNSAGDIWWYPNARTSLEAEIIRVTDFETVSLEILGGR